MTNRKTRVIASSLLLPLLSLTLHLVKGFSLTNDRIWRKTAQTYQASPRSHPSGGLLKADSSLYLSIKFTSSDKKGANEDADPQSVADDGEDFSMFMEGLKQWPLYPSDNAEEEVPEPPTPSSGRYRGVNPLGNFFKFEAILDLATSSNDEGKNSNGNGNNETYFSNILSAADQLVKTVSAKEAATVADLLEQEGDSTLEDTIRFLENSTEAKALSKPEKQSSPPPPFGKAAGAIVKDASARIEYLVTEASAALSKNSVQDLLIRASLVFSKNGTVTSVEDVTNDIVNVATKVAQDQGLDAQFAADRARETTNYAASMLSVANSLFGAGYAFSAESGKAESVDSPLVEVLNIQDSRPLFADAPSARRVDPFQYKSVVKKGAEMGTLAGAIYEDATTKSRKLGHSFVANGTTADVSWMVTDSIDCVSSFIEPTDGQPVDEKPIFVRTITIRGFDASDESVDRERLLNIICKAAGEPMSPNVPSVLFHSGLLSTAREIYAEMKKYISWTSPHHKLVFNGHSIGGALSILVLFLLACDKGADYAMDRVLRVFSHGSPPVSAIVSTPDHKHTSRRKPKPGSSKKKGSDDEMYHCPVLEAFGLPQTIVYGYVQPYDPIVRFLTDYDPLYPLVDDLGKDEVTLYSTGPPRSLRPLTRALFQSWDGWPEFRDNWKTTNQNYQSVGIQHVMLPEPLRYLNDRFVSANVAVPPTEAIVRISSPELLPTLNDIFPLDVFQISLIPQAVRSFLHHFFPAYDFTIANYAAKLEKEANRPTDKEKSARRPSSTTSSVDAIQPNGTTTTSIQ